ncbi:unnamed protein product [Mucor hiemalis]
MTDLQESFGNIEDEAFLMPYGGPEEPEHGRHHRHHPHKHHYKHPEGPDHGHHHKGHKHHKHHHKHHPEPVPPPPAPGANDLSGEINIFPFEGAVSDVADKPHHGHPHKPFCKVEELDASSTVFKFSPEEFKRAGIFLNGQFSRGGHVRLLKSSDESIQDVRVNVTLYSGRDDLNKEVKLSAFDNKGQYAVQIERGHFQGRKPPHHKPPHHKPPHKRPDEDEDEDREEEREGHDDDERRQEDCLVYNVDIEFPSNIAYFDDIELHIKAAQRIQGGKGIEGIEFGSVKAGLGRGAIIFDGLRAKKLLLGVINGVVMGTYQPSESFSAGSVRGATKVNIEPTGDNINVTASSTFGPASVDIPADSYSGDFALFNLFGETSSINAPNPEDIHVTKFKHTLKAGYYKEEHTGSRIVVAAKLHGGEYLSFN